MKRQTRPAGYRREFRRSG